MNKSNVNEIAQQSTRTPPQRRLPSFLAARPNAAPLAAGLLPPRAVANLARPSRHTALVMPLQHSGSRTGLGGGTVWLCGVGR